MPSLQIVPTKSSPPPALVSPDAVSPAPIVPPGKPRRKKREPPHLECEELARLFHVILAPRDRAIFRLMYHAGLPASELGMIELRDYDRQTERIMIHRLKGSNSGQHHCCRVLSRVMHAWLKVRALWQGPLFPSNRRTGMERRNLDLLMKCYGEASGLAPKLCHCHIWKHTCACDLLDLGFGISDVQDHLGHVNIQSTAIYAEITNRRRQQMAEQVKDTWR